MTPGNQTKQPPPEQLYFLLSLAPSSGVAIYEFEGSVHQCDTVAGRRDHTKRSFDLKEQIDVGIYFNRLSELLAFCRREYLKDKKDAYYGTLFTRHLPKSTRVKTLRFLNDPQLCRIPMSRMVVSALREVADADLVATVLQEVHELMLENIKACLASELHDVVFARAALNALRSASPVAQQVFKSMRKYVPKQSRSTPMGVGD